MNTYERIKLIHGMIGAVALIAFWVAALARKGELVHRRAGKVFFISLVFVMLSTVPFIAISVIQRRPAHVLLYVYLILVNATAVYLSWRSIRNKRDFKYFTGPLFRGLAIAVALLGIAVLGLSTTAKTTPQALFQAGLSTIGIVVGSNMLMLARSATPDKQWWLSQHLNGAAVNFAAAHGSFVSIGLASLLPEFRGPWMVSLSSNAVLVLALVGRLWIGRYYFKPARSVRLLQRAMSILD
jgi:hypothetical protein